MAPKLNDVFDYCKFLGQAVDCGLLFKESLTEDGLCFTFNGLNSRSIFNEEL